MPLTEELIDGYVSSLEDAAFVVELPESFPAIVRDPDDDPVLQTAILGRADVLCTRDAAFEHKSVRNVCDAYGIRILDDIALMEELRRLSDLGAASEP
jgi:predicted nucleic acid-binding protein